MARRRRAHARPRCASADLDAVVPLHGMRLPLGCLLVVRAFELWTHENDIRRAAGLPASVPDPADLRLMTDLAVRLLPLGVARVAGEAAASTCTWCSPAPAAAPGTSSSATGPPRDGGAGGGIVADAVGFCRLVADRIGAGRARRARHRGDRARGHRPRRGRRPRAGLSGRSPLVTRPAGSPRSRGRRGAAAPGRGAAGRAPAPRWPPRARRAGGRRRPGPASRASFSARALAHTFRRDSRRNSRLAVRLAGASTRSSGVRRPPARSSARSSSADPGGQDASISRPGGKDVVDALVVPAAQVDAVGDGEVLRRDHPRPATAGGRS